MTYACCSGANFRLGQTFYFIQSIGVEAQNASFEKFSESEIHFEIFSEFEKFSDSEFHFENTIQTIEVQVISRFGLRKLIPESKTAWIQISDVTSTTIVHLRMEY